MTDIHKLVQLFDTWAGELSPDQFREFVLPSYYQISSGVRERLAQTQTPSVPLILYAKGANYALEELSKPTGWDVLGLDWLIGPNVAKQIVGDRVALQGNVDPSVLYAGRDAIEREVMKVAKAFGVEGRSKGHIFNLGHGITPGVDPDDLRWFLECVHRYTKPSYN